MSKQFTTEELTQLSGILSFYKSIAIGGFKEIVFSLDWENLSDRDVKYAIGHLDEAHRALLKAPASLNRNIHETAAGTVVHDLLLKLEDML